MFSLSSYFSVQYLVLLLPATVGLYAVLPQKPRRVVLLLASYLFFWAISGKLIAYLLFSTLSVHHIGLWLEGIQAERDRCLAAAPKEERKAVRGRFQRQLTGIVAFGVVLHLGLLLLVKYTPFFATNLNHLFQLLGLSLTVNIPSFAMPIGISFYTLQAVSYCFDVYRGKIPADRNLFRLALFMSFFPQIMEGPICRYGDTAHQLWAVPPIRWENFLFGVQRILFGLMKKVVVADRLNLFIRQVFSGYAEYDGFVIAVAVVCYTIQLYMDFSGTMDLVMGSGQIFGVTLPENFRRPFFSRNIAEFWRRWHVTLGTWFKDYVFYPVSMAKPMKKLTSWGRKRLGPHYGPLLAGSVALFCVWLGNGLWHGAGWHFIFFGMYHFFWILLENLTEPLTLRWAERFHVNRECLPYRGFQIARTAVLVCIGELFFRADGLRAGLAMFQKMVTEFSLTTLRDGTIFSLGLDKKGLPGGVFDLGGGLCRGSPSGAGPPHPERTVSAECGGSVAGWLWADPGHCGVWRIRHRLCAGGPHLCTIFKGGPSYGKKSKRVFGPGGVFLAGLLGILVGLSALFVPRTTCRSSAWRRSPPTAS